MCADRCCFRSPFLAVFGVFNYHYPNVIFLFSRQSGVLLSERVWIWIRNGWVRGVVSEVLF